MQTQTGKFNNSCPSAEIAAYIDGELSASAEMELEKHFTVCGECLKEFNEQKKLLNALDFAFDERSEIVLPKDFTKTIVVQAESNVSGLRRPEERYRAFYLCAILFLLIIVGLGSETESVFNASAAFVEQIITVAGYTAHLVFNIAVAMTTILRIISGQVIFSPVFAILVFAVFLLLLVYLSSRLPASFDRSENLEI